VQRHTVKTCEIYFDWKVKSNSYSFAAVNPLFSSVLHKIRGFIKTLRKTVRKEIYFGFSCVLAVDKGGPK